MNRWEYMVVILSLWTHEQWDSRAKVLRMPQGEAVLNEWGSQGWEVVKYNFETGPDGNRERGVFVLKRPRA